MNDTDKSTGGAFGGEQRSIETAKWLEHPHRISEHSWPEGTMPVVSINCITYNHEGYIRDAIEGVLMQETTFPVEILIHDDASTDRTADILREYESRYPHLIKPIYQGENQYSIGKKPSVTNLARALGSFIAFCEGDDYWLDKAKLQKQIEILKKNPSVNLSFHSSQAFNCITGKASRIGKYASGDSLLAAPEVIIRRKGMIPTASLVVRRKSAVGFCEFISSRPWLPVGDVYLTAIASSSCGACYIDSDMSLYRQLAPGSWNRRNRGSFKSVLLVRLRMMEGNLDVCRFLGFRHSKYFLSASLRICFRLLLRGQGTFYERLCVTPKFISVLFRHVLFMFVEFVLAVRRKITSVLSFRER